ncbi:MAG: hypothetical protein ACHQ7M_17865 [Chloroflexota bacterium]
MADRVAIVSICTMGPTSLRCQTQRAKRGSTDACAADGSRAERAADGLSLDSLHL